MPENKETINEVKYEALAQLMAHNQEEQKERWNRFNTSFSEFKTELHNDMNELKAYNKKQNGNIADALRRINALETAEATRVINCPLNAKVRTLEDAERSDKAVRKWIVRVLGIVVGSLSVIWILFQIAIRVFEISPK